MSIAIVNSTAIAANLPEVAGDDIFGFTTPTDVGNAGESGFANENDGRFGKRSGSYRAFNAKYEFGHTFAPDWWLGLSAFGAANVARGVGGLADVNRVAFDGLSFEVMHRLVRRSAASPFAVAVAAEPRWAQIDGVSGLRSEALAVSFKLFVDAVVVADRLYWAGNAAWTPQRAEDPGDRGRWLSSSSLTLSSAVAYRLSERLYVGAEARYLASFSTLLPGAAVGHAVYAGPTLWWKVTERIAFNTTLQPQLAGRAIANPGLRLDLDNFERVQFRAKLTVAFQ